MNLITWIVFGLLAGGIAKLIVPGKDVGGCLVTVLIGVAGALLGGLLGRTLFEFGGVTGFDLRSLGIAVLGSVVLLVAFRLLIKPVN